MKWSKTILLFCVVTMLAACSKDNEDIQPTQNGYTGPKRLASLTSISYSQSYNNYNPETGRYELSSTHGSKSGATLRWSSAGLLTGMGMEGIASDLITVEYDGNKVQRIIIDAAALGASIGNVTYTCTYTGDNLTETYANTPNGWAKTTLGYSPSGELISVREEESDGSLTTTTLVWDNGNVTHVEETSSNSHSSTIYNYTYDYLYDNMTSPYKGMEVYALLGDGKYMLSRNNVLRIIAGHSSTDSPEVRRDTTVYTYTYDGDWPVTQSQNRNSNSTYSGGYRTENTNYLRYTDGSGSTVPQTFTINVTSNMPDSTSVYVSGGGEYEAGRQVVLSASCYQSDISFRCWNDGVTDNPRTLTATENAEYIAVFGATNEK